MPRMNEAFGFPNWPPIYTADLNPTLAPSRIYYVQCPCLTPSGPIPKACGLHVIVPNWATCTDPTWKQVETELTYRPP